MKSILCNGRIVKANELLLVASVNKEKEDINEKLEDYWLVLARFANEMLAVTRLDKIPNEIEQYVRYNNPVPLPSIFTENVHRYVNYGITKN